MRCVAILVAVLVPAAAVAQVDHQAIADRAVELVLPTADAFARRAAALAEASAPDCAAMQGEAVRARFGEAWDAWMALQPYRFGPLEEEQRALQVAFWPDPRGMVGRTVERLLATEPAQVDDPATFAELSVAGRGLPALERLLYGDAGPVALDQPFRCRYLDAAADDLARRAAGIAARWHDPWAGWMTGAGTDGSAFLDHREVTQRLYATLLWALQETVEHRLVPPLGTVDAPKPLLAEAWRSGRSLRQIEGVVDAAAAELQQIFFPELGPEPRAAIEAALETVRSSEARVAELGTLPEAVEGAGRIRVEVLAQSIERLVVALQQHLGPGIGVAEGFNASDGD